MSEESNEAGQGSVDSRSEGAELDPGLLVRDGAGASGEGALSAGAARLRAGLESWEAAEPPADLIERTLAGLALAQARASADEVGEAAEAPTLRVLQGDADARVPRRRSTVEVLTSAPLSQPSPVAPTRRRLILRALTQAIAATLLFALSSGAVAVFYPAVTHALAERDGQACQARLLVLQKAARRYRAEHPEGERLRDVALRRALLEGGYVSEDDLSCPSRRGQAVGVRSYGGDLRRGVAPVGSHAGSDMPLFWDNPQNHDGGFHVIRAEGSPQWVSAEDLGALWRRAEGPR